MNHILALASSSWPCAIADLWHRRNKLLLYAWHRNLAPLVVATQETGSAWIAAAVVGLLEHFFSVLSLINVRWYFILSLWDGTRWNSFVMDVYSYTWLLNLVHLGINCNNCSIWTANLYISLKSSRFSISPTKGHSFCFPQGFADVFNI